MSIGMSKAVLAIHFGEPPTPDPAVVREYLTEIFYQNADLEGTTTEEAATERARELAERRAPGLLEEYEEMGGSPMNEQAAAQVNALASALTSRGFDVRTELAYQFMEPSIETAIEGFASDDIDELVLLPIYPLCGPSTTVASLERALAAIEDEDDWDPTVSPISGWHRHPRYLRLRTDNIREYAQDNDVGLTDPSTRLVFSAHGTPVHYLREGSRYGVYVEEVCAAIGGLLGGVEYELGFQNHENRDIPWTTPAIEDVVESVEAEQIVVEPVSFMHEQSETIGELDDDLAADAAAHGLTFHRVPIPHDAPSFIELLADVTEPFLASIDHSLYQFRSCQCAPGALCLNAPRS